MHVPAALNPCPAGLRPHSLRIPCFNGNSITKTKILGNEVRGCCRCCSWAFTCNQMGAAHIQSWLGKGGGVLRECCSPLPCLCGCLHAAWSIPDWFASFLNPLLPVCLRRSACCSTDIATAAVAAGVGAAAGEGGGAHGGEYMVVGSACLCRHAVTPHICTQEALPATCSPAPPEVCHLAATQHNQLDSPRLLSSQDFLPTTISLANYECTPALLIP